MIGRVSHRGAAVALFSVWLALVAPVAFAADPWPELATTPPVDKRFTVTRHYDLRVTPYQPAAMVPVRPQPPETGYAGPEEVLIGQFSAQKALDYDWWLATWSADSQATIARAEPDDAARAARLGRWRTAIGPARAELTHFIETRRHVVLRFRLLPAPADEDAEQARAFVLDAGAWRAALDLQDDPVTRFGGTGETRVERVVR